VLSCLPEPTDAAAPAPTTLDLREPRVVALPAWHGSLLIERTPAGGVATEHLADVTVRARTGGERFRFAPQATARSLKKQFQSRGIPAWARRTPLLSQADGRIVFVPGLGIDAAFQAAPGADQRSLVWQPD
jgi:tRNA(Ile)-lysidine synthase